MYLNTKAIAITPENYNAIMSKTPFTVEVLDALKATHPYLYVVQEPNGAIYVMPYSSLTFFGFGASDTGKVWWSDVYIK